MKTNWRGANVLLVGLGLHGGGEATVRWLVRHGAQLRVNDTKTKAQLQSTLTKLGSLKRVTFHFGSHRRQDFDWADLIVANPGVPFDHPDLQYARKKKKTLVNEATLFIDQAPGRLVGVTGTRGKTTVTHLITAMLKVARQSVIMSGNVRQVAMLDQLDRLTQRTTSVVELSSYQLEFLPLIQKSPTVAVYTNLKVDHLNRHGTMSVYGSIKANILRYQKVTDHAVLNADNVWTKKAAPLTRGRVIWFSRRGAAGQWSVFPSRGWVVEKHGRLVKRLVPLKLWSMVGDHQLENLLAAVAAGRAMGLEARAMQKAIASFRGVPHRQELVRTWRGQQFVNDTAATSPDGALAAMSVFPKAVFIIGGTDKKLDFRVMAATMVKKKLPAVFLPGNATDKLWKLLRRGKYRAPHMMARSMDEAVRRAVELAKPKQTIVLSPGAASFGLFVHEFDRGDKFVRAVKALR